MFYYLVIASYLFRQVSEHWKLIGQFDQVQPCHILYPLLWLRIDRIQVESSTT